MSKKKVLITGGTRGIGKSISEIFHVNNYSIYITGSRGFVRVGKRGFGCQRRDNQMNGYH